MTHNTSHRLRQPFTAQQAEFVAELRTKCHGLILSCGDNQLSHAPFVYYDDRYYIFISTLAARTKALLTTQRGQMINDETAIGNIYSRRRLVQSVRAEAISCGDACYLSALDALQTRHGKTVAVLRGLSDFYLVRLIPEDGQLILGFGQSFDLPSGI